MNLNYRSKFWARVDIAPSILECWLYTGDRDADGYGRYKGQYAHRLALSLSGIPINARVAVHHRCHNKSCVNPAHLQSMKPSDHCRVTRAEQTRMVSLGS